MSRLFDTCGASFPHFCYLVNMQPRLICRREGFYDQASLVRASSHGVALVVRYSDTYCYI